MTEDRKVDSRLRGNDRDKNASQYELRVASHEV
jgi:hypothetical protein